MRGLVFVGALLFALAAPAYADDINPIGSYAYTGSNPDGSTYNGTVEVMRENKYYTVSYNEKGVGKYKGVGIVTGNTISVAVIIEGRDAVFALTAQSDGSLIGTWAWRGEEGLGAEVWIKRD